MRTAADLTTDPALGLTLSTHRARAQSFDLLGYLIMHSQTLGDAMLRLTRYAGLWAQGIEVTAKPPPPCELTFEFRAPPALAWPHMQSILAGSVVVSRVITGADVEPRRVEVQLPRPSDEGPWLALFGVRPIFGSDRTALVFDPATWALPVRTSEPRLVSHLEKTAEALLARIGSDDSIEGRARAHIARHLETQTGVTLAKTARALGMSRRTLQRRLNEGNVTFAGLVDQVRRDLAMHLLNEQGLEVKETAFRLGFAQPSAFSRAFKRWTGRSPVAWARD